MLKGVKKAIIAFSTGPDSTCLLDALYKIYRSKIEFILCYVNHGLRPGRVLKSEEKLTKEYAQRYKASYKILKIKFLKKGNIEARAREERYKALLNYMRQTDTQRIILGHNLDDVVETFFMNLIRGSGARGLESIPPVRLPFIRPLINLKKSEILNYLINQQLPYSLDETNISLEYRRNILRHKIIPKMVEINPRLYDTIKKEIEILRQDDSYLLQKANEIYKKVVTKEDGYITLDTKRIMRYNKSILNRVLMSVIKELIGGLSGYETKHYKAIINLMDKETGKRIALPKRLYAQKSYEQLIIGRRKEYRPEETIIRLNDIVVLGPQRLKVRTAVVSQFNLKCRKENCEVFDLNKVEPPFIIRGKKEGDFLETKMGRKKLKKFYNEFKIPFHRRNKLMMLCDEKGILWIFGIARVHRALIDKTTRKFLVVEFEYLN